MTATTSSCVATPACRTPPLYDAQAPSSASTDRAQLRLTKERMDCMPVGFLDGNKWRSENTNSGRARKKVRTGVHIGAARPPGSSDCAAEARRVIY